MPEAPPSAEGGRGNLKFVSWASMDDVEAAIISSRDNSCSGVARGAVRMHWSGWSLSMLVPKMTELELHVIPPEVSAEGLTCSAFCCG